MSDPSPLAASDALLARFQRKIAANAAAWLDFVQAHGDDPAALDRELANLSKAAQQALAEPLARDDGLALVGETWSHIDLRGLWQEWRALLADGLRVSREIGQPQHQARLLDQLGEVARLLGDNQAAQEQFEQAAALFHSLENAAGAGRSLAHLSQVQLARNQWKAALQSSQEAVALLQALDRPNDLATVHNNWGLVCQEWEQWSDALAHFEQAEAGFRAAGNLRGQAKTLVNRAETLRRRGDWTNATDQLRAAIELYQRIDDPLHRASTQMNLSILHHEAGQPAEALALSLEAEATFRRLRHRPFLARVCNNHGIFLATLGRLDEAEEAFEESARLHQENGDRLYAASALINAAEVLIDQQCGPEAGERLAQARGWLDALTQAPRWVHNDYQAQRARLEGLAGAQPAP
jgi:tetratricopeptide (TPR) repeat protein